MTNVTITALEAAQHEEVSRLFHETWHETQAHLQDSRVSAFRNLDYFRQRLSTRQERTLVATVQGRVAGFSVWTEDTLNSLFLRKAFRGQGLGAALCNATESTMASQGHKLLRLYCVQGNTLARSFYERNGWRLERTASAGAVPITGGIVEIPHWIMVKAVMP